MVCQIALIAVKILPDFSSGRLKRKAGIALTNMPELSLQIINVPRETSSFFLLPFDALLSLQIPTCLCSRSSAKCREQELFLIRLEM